MRPRTDADKALRNLPGYPTLTREEKQRLREAVGILTPKERVLFYELAKNLGKPRCTACVNKIVDSTQLAATKRNLVKAGFDVPDSTRLFCQTCGKKRHHYTLNSLIVGESTRRAQYTNAEWRRARSHIPDKDAFTGVTGSGRLEMDHRRPAVRFTSDEERIDVEDPDAVNITFQKLTPEHNLLKSRKCESCEKTGERPAWLGMNIYFAGGKQYTEELGCWGCGWAYPEIAKAYINGQTPAREQMEEMTEDERNQLLLRVLGRGAGSNDNNRQSGSRKREPEKP